jgi:cyclopropane-fatty-acyl-phospholipid synthase
VAEILAPLVKLMVGTDAAVGFEFWDGSRLGPPDVVGTLQIRSPDAIRRMLWAPGELGVARAFVSGDIALDGDLFSLLRTLQGSAPTDLRSIGAKALPTMIGATRRLGLLGGPLPPPAEECRPAGSTRPDGMPRPSATTTTSAMTSTG